MKKKALKQYELMRVARRMLTLLYWVLHFPRIARFLMMVFRPLYVEKETILNRVFRYGTLGFGGGVVKAADLRVWKYGTKALRDSLSKVLKAVKKDKPIVWTEWILNGEIFNGFDITVMCTELLVVFGNVKGEEYPPMMMEVAEEHGTPQETCSAVKHGIGTYLANQLPEPELILAGSHPCDSSVSVYQQQAYITGAPTFVFDAPYWKDEESFEYCEKVQWDQLRFVEDQLKQKVDWDKLKESLDHLNKMNYYLREITQMHRAIPSPGTQHALYLAWLVKEVNVNAPEALKLAEGVYKLTKKRLERGEGIVKDEKIRVIFWDPFTGFWIYLFLWMQEEFGAVVVADYIASVINIDIDTSSKESMMRDLGKYQMYISMARQCHGPIEMITDELEKTIDDYSADCILLAGHAGCKHVWAAMKIVEDMCKRKGIPTLVLEIDIMDKRHTPETEIRKKISDFFRSHGWA